LLHFLDRKSELAEVWDTEFRALGPETSASPAGVSRIDHIAQTMKHEDMLTWTLFYTSIFQVEKAQMVDVADAAGHVHSRAIQSRDGALRLTLNGVDTHRTFAGRFVSDTAGASVQHIAFATDDIFATAGKLQENGFKALPIPANYYIDLKTRFDLDTEILTSLQAANILFDEDAKGAFFQLYSRPYGEGFFFEIVERRNGYDGYGAPNASYRTAALKHLSRTTGVPRR
jgi:4-hydroxyphenylpyruvate dioxygenase